MLRPDNFVAVGLLSAEYVRVIADCAEEGSIDEPNLSQLSWALNMFTTVLQVASYPQFCLLLFSLDSGLASQTLAPLPKPPKKKKPQPVEPDPPAPTDTVTRVSIEIQTDEIPEPPKPKKTKKGVKSADLVAPPLDQKGDQPAKKGSSSLAEPVPPKKTAESATAQKSGTPSKKDASEPSPEKAEPPLKKRVKAEPPPQKVERPAKKPAKSDAPEPAPRKADQSPKKLAKESAPEKPPKKRAKRAAQASAPQESDEPPPKLLDEPPPKLLDEPPPKLLDEPPPELPEKPLPKLPEEPLPKLPPSTGHPSGPTNESPQDLFVPPVGEVSPPPEEPQRPSAVLPRLRIDVDIYPAMLRTARRAFTVAKDAVERCLFKSGLTIAPGDGSWVTSSAALNRTRRDLVHSLLGLSSLSFFTEYPLSTTFPNFPFVRFVKSVCYLSRKFLSEPHGHLRDLLRNCLAFLTRLCSFSEFRGEIARLHSPFLLQAISLGPDAPPIFTCFGPLVHEGVAFFFIAACFQPTFVHLVATEGYSNAFVFHLLQAAQEHYERSGFSYLHSLIIAALLLLLFDDTVATQLNQPWRHEWKCAYTPDRGSHADLLLNVLLNICATADFWPSVICTFHMIAPYVNAVTIATANRVMELFEAAVANGGSPVLTRLIVEGLATIVQNPGNGANGFWPALVGKAGIVEKLGEVGAKCPAAVAAVSAFVEEALKVGLRRTQVPAGELVRIKKHPYVFGGGIKKTWGDWSLRLFELAFDSELRGIGDLEKLYGMAA
jgi:hypothetical protein